MTMPSWETKSTWKGNGTTSSKFKTKPSWEVEAEKKAATKTKPVDYIKKNQNLMDFMATPKKLAPSKPSEKVLSNNRYEEANKVDQVALDRNTKKIKSIPIVGNFLNTVLDLGIKAQNSPVGKFLDRTSQSIQEGLTGNTVDKPMTGNNAADTAADVGGNIFSLFAPVGGSGVTRNAMSATDEAIRLAGKSKFAQNALNFVGNKIGKTATNIGTKTLKGAAEGLGVTAQEVGTKSMSNKDIKNSLAMNVGGGGGLGLLGGALGKGISKLRTTLKTPAEELAQNTEKIALQTVVKPITQQGKFTIKNSAYDSAVNDYNSAIETIQNHFGTNELRANEIPKIKSDLGIDLDSIINRMETSEKGVKLPTPQTMQLKRTAGVASNNSYDLAGKLKNQSNYKNTFKPLNDVLSPSNKSNVVTPSLSNELPGVANKTTVIGTDNLNKYVDASPIDISIGKNDKVTSQNIRDKFVSKENGQVIKGIHLADEMKKLAPNEQEGIQLFVDSGGNMQHLTEMATHEDPIMDSFIPNTKTTYRDAYNQALNLSPEAQKVADMAKQYYTESGAYALKTGSTKSVLDNYASRMWQKNPAGVKTEIGRSQLNPSTSHAKERTFETVGEGLLAGKQPVTLKANELLSIHNQEMAHANTTRELATALENSGIGKYQKDIPEGFTNIQGLDKHTPTADGYAVQSFVAPKGIADGLKAITDPDYLKMWDNKVINGLKKYQDVVKTVNLSASVFHHITLTAQALYNNKGPIDFIRHWQDLSKLDSKIFNQAEEDFIRHTGTTTKISANFDTLSKLTDKGTVADKISNLPVLKQGKQLVEANNNLLFDKIQRWLKVTDYNMKNLDYIGKHPNVTGEELFKAKSDIAKEVNLAYGGLNWKSLGRSKTGLNIERLALLAPDWTESSVRMLGKATERNLGGHYARQQYITALVGGMLLTEGLNKMFTGHFTDKNPKGQEFTIQTSPGVYASLFRSGVGDAVKLGSNIAKFGVIGGVSKSLQGKLSPLARVGIAQATNTDYLGRKITDPNNGFLQNTYNSVSNAAQQGLPIPFGAPNIVRYAKDPNKTVGGAIGVGTGALTYAKDNTQTGSVYDKPTKSYDDNLLHRMFATSTQKQDLNIADKAKAFKKSNTDNSVKLNEEIGQSLSKGVTPNAFTLSEKYGVSAQTVRSSITDSKNKLKSLSYSPLVKEYLSMSRENRTKFYSSLSPSDKQRIDNAMKGIKP